MAQDQFSSESLCKATPAVRPARNGVAARYITRPIQMLFKNYYTSVTGSEVDNQGTCPRSQLLLPFSPPVTADVFSAEDQDGLCLGPETHLITREQRRLSEQARLETDREERVKRGGGGGKAADGSSSLNLSLSLCLPAECWNGYPLSISREERVNRSEKRREERRGEERRHERTAARGGITRHEVAGEVDNPVMSVSEGRRFGEKKRGMEEERNELQRPRQEKRTPSKDLLTPPPPPHPELTSHPASKKCPPSLGPSQPTCTSHNTLEPESHRAALTESLRNAGLPTGRSCTHAG
ncbi:unnamed protein product [Pleuronectes platessa]|uniref:Uncharacterized protein n=1 Tax=Pleuronectes platessa TaxID=8262 RepID=A0A9N7TT21_PLEPL|nr:unnamed protein product [Pleuronectes platessa]